MQGMKAAAGAQNYAGVFTAYSRYLGYMYYPEGFL